MKVKQSVTRTETREIEIEFPLYVQHDVGEHLYVVTYRYELQSPHVPTFLVTSITETDRGFEVDQGSSLKIDSDVSASKVDVAEWLATIQRFEKWAQDKIALLKVRADKTT